MEAKLDRVTFTGADYHNDLGALRDFQQQYPAAELAVLLCPSRLANGEAGYPPYSWIEKFAAAVHPRIALHLCEETIGNFLQGEAHVWRLARLFRRVQLNIFQKTSPVDPMDVDFAATGLKEDTGADLIVPMNLNNADMVHALTNPDIQILFDGSGGTGKLAESYGRPLKGRFCGWAGGLGPHNIVAEHEKIRAVATGSYWVDMESRVKDPQGYFSIPLCVDVMQKLGF